MWAAKPYLIDRDMGYALNYYYVTKPPDRLPVKYDRFPRPDHLVYMCECAGNSIMVYPVGYVYGRWEQFTAEIPYEMHFGEFDMLFIDSHVESGTMADRYHHDYFATPNWAG